MVSYFLVVALLYSSFGAGYTDGYCSSAECQASTLNATQRSFNGDVHLLQISADAERAIVTTIVMELKSTPIVGNKQAINTWAGSVIDNFKTVVLNTFLARPVACGTPSSVGGLVKLAANQNSVLQSHVYITVGGMPKCHDFEDFDAKPLLKNGLNTDLKAYADSIRPSSIYMTPQDVLFYPNDYTNGGASDWLPSPSSSPSSTPPTPSSVPHGSTAPEPSASPATPAIPSAAPATAPPTPATAKGDPHLSNVLGQHFDLQQPGIHAMIVIPKHAGRNGALLNVQALVEQKGTKCTDMYFTMINVTGRWVGAQESDVGDSGTSVQYFADKPRQATVWTPYGTVSLKVVWGHTPDGVQYLNLLAKDLRHAGFKVGGLLGEDDHTEAATSAPGCRKSGEV